MAQDNQPQATWWGQFRLDEGQTVQWRIGLLKLAIQRLPYEWQIAYEQDREAALRENAADALMEMRREKYVNLEH